MQLSSCSLRFLVTYGLHDQLHSLHSFEGIQGPEVKNVFEKFKPRFLNDPLCLQLDKNRSVCKPCSVTDNSQFALSQ